MPDRYRCPRCQTESGAEVCPSCGSLPRPAGHEPALPPAGLDRAPAGEDLQPAERAGDRSSIVEALPPIQKAAPRPTASPGAGGATPGKRRRRSGAGLAPAVTGLALTHEKPASGSSPGPTPSAARRRGGRRAAAATPALDLGSSDAGTETSAATPPLPARGRRRKPGEATGPVEARPDPLARGAGFEGRYEILGEVGRGGMGAVFKAYDRELEEVIALKSLVDAVRTDPGRIARFKNEIKLARKLSHPNIARVHDLVEVHGRLCLSMAYIEGPSLDALIREQGGLEPERVLKYLRGLASALALAHSSGIVHRDIKPANIIVDAYDAPHIVDFGIAASGSDSSSARVGTPSHMAPECWLAGRPGVVVDARCDLYALGVTLYQMLCGHVPFWNRNLNVLMDMHCHRPPRRPQALVAGVPDVLDAVVLRLLEKEPDARFQRAGEILEALEPGGGRALRVLKSRPQGSVPPILNPPGARGKVLLADGDRNELRSLAGRIRDHDFLVVDAQDGAQAVEKAFLELPDLILLDTEMAVLDVLDVLRLLQKDERTRHTPVVVLSRIDDPGHEALARDVGAAAWLVKPIAPAVLDLLIGRYFG